MSASLDIRFGKPVDEKYKEYAEVWKACKKARVEIPKDVSDFFNGEEPDGNALWLDESDMSNKTVSGDEFGYERIIDLRYLPKEIKLIKVSLDY